MNDFRKWPFDILHRHGMVEIDGPTSIPEGDACDPQPTMTQKLQDGQ
jgi:hypothetical protein